ncbi:MAG TPA: MFS transporter [Pirellulales bacterium]|nr:MFS transporter [Pirellulales bacterium]
MSETSAPPAPEDAFSADDESAAAPTSVRHIVLAVTTLASFLLYLDRVCISEVLKTDAAREALGLSDNQIGWTLSAFFWSYALGQVPSGWISDRFGARLMLTIYILSWSLFTAMTGWATGFAMLFVLRLSVGVAQAGAYPTSGAILGRWIPLLHRGMASSVVAFGGRVGGALAPYLTSLLIAACGGWRAVMLAYGAVGVVVAGAFAHFFRNRPDQHPHCNRAEQALISMGRPPAAASDGSHGADAGTPLVARRVVSSVSMWLMCVSQFTTNIGWVFLITWLTRYLKDEKHVSDQLGGAMATVVLSVGMAGMLLGGRITDWASRRWGIRWGRIVPLVASRFVAAAAFCLLPALDSPWAATAMFALVAFATDLGVAGTWAYMQDVGGKYVGAILGWGNMWGNLGAAVSPPLLRWLSLKHGSDLTESWNWNIAFGVCAASFVISGLTALGIDATERIAPDDHA